MKWSADDVTQFSEFLPQGTYAWNSEKYFNKLNNMSAVITQINQGKGPDFIGMCEVESHLVVDDLTKTLSKTGKTYQYIWHDSKDERGIDNALLYKKEWVQSVQSKLFDINNYHLSIKIVRFIRSRFSERDIICRWRCFAW